MILSFFSYKRRINVMYVKQAFSQQHEYQKQRGFQYREIRDLGSNFRQETRISEATIIRKIHKRVYDKKSKYIFAVAEISEADMASDIGKIETKAQFLAMKPKGFAGVLATAINIFLNIIFVTNG